MKIAFEIPDGDYCESCSFFNDGAGYEYRTHCQLLKVELNNISCISDNEKTLKDKNCPTQLNHFEIIGNIYENPSLAPMFPEEKK